VAVLNPKVVNRFAATLCRSKTDPADAQVLAEYARRMPFQPWHPPSAAALKLVAVARRLEALTEMMTQEKNRLHAASLSEALPPLIRRDLLRSIGTQQRAIQRLTQAAVEFVISDPQLARRHNLLALLMRHPLLTHYVSAGIHEPAMQLWRRKLTYIPRRGLGA